MHRPTRTWLRAAILGAALPWAIAPSLVVAATPGVGLPLPPEAMPGGPSVALRDTSEEVRAAYSGVGLLSYGSTCTAVLVRPGDGETPAQAPAYALTNGHCVDLFDATSVVRDGQPTPGAGGVAFGVAADGSPVAEASVASIRWATMKGTDLAVIELDTTLADLEAKGVVAYPIADAVAPGTPVVVVGGPASTDGSDRTLRLGACTSGPPKDLFEWRWTWFGFPSSDCADIRAGSSGSPVFDPTTGSVVALVNTTTQGSGDVTDCSMGRPCEVTDEGLVSVRDAVYGPSVGALRGCFDASWTFAGPGPDCALDPGDGLGVESWTLATNPGATTLVGGFESPSTWDIVLAPASDRQTLMRLAEGRAGAIDCHDPSVYGDPVDVPADLHLDPPLPTEDGSHLMCLIGGTPTDAGVDWQPTTYPTVLRAYIDRTPPIPPIELIAHEVDEGWLVEPLYISPELSQYAWKWGPADLIDCADPAGYAGYRGFPIVLQKADAPVRLCVVGYDDANNATAPLDRVFSLP